METILIFSIVTILSAGLAIRHYQVKAKHAVNHWQFERGKHEEYKRAYYSKGDELEQIKTLHEMATFEKKQALRKAAESNKHVLELQNKNAGLSLQLSTATEMLQKVERLLKDPNGAHGQRTLKALIDVQEYLKKA